MEMEKQRIAAERKRIEEERKAFGGEKKKRQEEARRKNGLPTTITPRQLLKALMMVSCIINLMVTTGIAWLFFPFCESAIANTKVKEQIEFTDFMIKYTNNIPNMIFTHSFYPYHEYRTEHKLRRINRLIHEGLEKEIWYGNSEFSKKKPDDNILKKLAKKINSDLILTFKISSTMTHPSEIRVTYNGYLVDIEKNIDYEKKK